MKTFKNNRGFTLIELLLVVAIVAIILAVIVPLGLRARIDAKYGIVRQNGSELASFASSWVEKSIQAQDEQTSTATVKDYFASLAGQNPGAAPDAACDGQWIADTRNPNNWHLVDPAQKTRNAVTITGRVMEATPDSAPEDVVEDVVPPDKVIRNPFNEVSVFRSPNDPEGPDSNGQPVTGALALGCDVETTGGWVYYAFAFQGTDSTTTAFNAATTFHAGMGITDIPLLRNGLFLGRFR